MEKALERLETRLTLSKVCYQCFIVILVHKLSGRKGAARVNTSYKSSHGGDTSLSFAAHQSRWIFR